jgi:hypothetical protein
LFSGALVIVVVAFDLTGNNRHDTRLRVLRYARANGAEHMSARSAATLIILFWNSELQNGRKKQQNAAAKSKA